MKYRVNTKKMLGLLLDEITYNRLDTCRQDSCGLCEQVKGVPIETDEYSDLSTSALTSQLPSALGKFGYSKESIHHFHWLETVYMCVKYKCFIYYNQRQVCLHAYWALIKRSHSNAEVYLAVLDHFHRKNWWLRIDCSFGGTFQAYPAEPVESHAPFVVSLDSSEDWLDLIGGDRVASSNKKQLIKVQVAQLNNADFSSYQIKLLLVNRCVV